MARRQVNVYSIERARAARARAGQTPEPGAGERHEEVMAALAGIRSLLEADARPAGAAHGPAPTEELLAEYKAGLQQVTALKSELISIEAAIERTKKEIASLHQSGISGDNFAGVTDELDAVVKGTEHATDAILQATEEIEQNARNLSAALKGEGDANMALEIQEQATRIFESCNFQDLTGQRITKVVNTLRYVEERVLKMIEIWGGLEAFKDIAAVPFPNPAGKDAMLHGPGDVESDPARVSQEDIDALFA